jgi:hypothetical protein
MAGGREFASGPKDNGPRNGPRSDPRGDSKTSESVRRPGGPPPVPPETGESKLSFLVRLPRAIGGIVAAPFKAVWRVVAATGGRIKAAAGAVTGAAGSVFRRERVTAIAAVIAAVAAVMAWRGTVDTETRRVSAELLDAFNSDDMWKARLTLQRYYYLLSGDKTAPADLARQTEDYFKSFVYQKTPLPAGRNAGNNRFGGDRDRQDEFLRQVDQSRQKIKNFYEDVIVFYEAGLLTKPFQDKVLKSRFHRNAGDFLECFWLPVELGQNAALYQGRKDDTDRRACAMIDWYRAKYPAAGRQTPACVPYASKQPDFCADPKAEAVGTE